MPVNHQGVEEWSRDEVRAGLADGSVLIVDVREVHEFAAGHMPGAVNIPLSSFDVEAIPMPKGQRVVFSCAAGVRSLRAIEAAEDAGLPLSAHYPGGFKDWLMHGEEVVTG
ncbi:MAG: rhodanese-like domain-containing protein [Bosea sp. (in: a-proteobacteria)]